MKSQILDVNAKIIIEIGKTANITLFIDCKEVLSVIIVFIYWFMIYFLITKIIKLFEISKYCCQFFLNNNYYLLTAFDITFVNLLLRFLLYVGFHALF